MTETTTSITVLVLSALTVLGFLASFGGQTITVSQISSWILFPAFVVVLVIAAIGIIRGIWSLSHH